MPSPRKSGNNRHAAIMQGLRRGVTSCRALDRKPDAGTFPFPWCRALQEATACAQSVQLGDARFLGHITLYNGCQGWHKQTRRIKSKTGSPTLRRQSILCPLMMHCLFKEEESCVTQNCPSLQGPLDLSTVAHTVPRSFAPNLIPAEQSTSSLEDTQPNPFPAFIFSLDVIVKFGEP
jgi:hypothetical protein